MILNIHILHSRANNDNRYSVHDYDNNKTWHINFLHLSNTPHTKICGSVQANGNIIFTIIDTHGLMFSVRTTAAPANVFVTGRTPSLREAPSDGYLVQSVAQQLLISVHIRSCYKPALVLNIPTSSRYLPGRCIQVLVRQNCKS